MTDMASDFIPKRISEKTILLRTAYNCTYKRCVFVFLKKRNDWDEIKICGFCNDLYVFTKSGGKFPSIHS